MRRTRQQREHDTKILNDLGLQLHGRQPSRVQRYMLDDLRRMREELDEIRTEPSTKTSRMRETALITATGRLLDRMAYLTNKRT